MSVAPTYLIPSSVPFVTKVSFLLLLVYASALTVELNNGNNAITAVIFVNVIIINDYDYDYDSSEASLIISVISRVKQVAILLLKAVV